MEKRERGSASTGLALAWCGPRGKSIESGGGSSWAFLFHYRARGSDGPTGEEKRRACAMAWFELGLRLAMWSRQLLALAGIAYLRACSVPLLQKEQSGLR
jgi:hypothetical protein